MKRLIALICSSLSLHAGAATVSDDVTAFLKQTMQEQRIPALQVAVIRHNKIVKLDAYGTANVENAVPATRDSIFSINSCTKAFTGVAIMQLVEAGKLGIDDPISRYWTTCPPRGMRSRSSRC
jgi:CubicO group peptidase (beta-lactamase class C family)